MNILAIDTSGPVAGVCVFAGGRAVYMTEMELGLTHSQTVMPAVERALSLSGMKCRDIDLFAAVAGPGSFTGVRLGVCALKGMAHAVDKKCVSIDALEALAMNMAYFDGLVCPILDARRGQVYCAAFDTSSGLPERILSDDACALEDFLDRLPKDKKLAFVGDGVRVNEPKLRTAPGVRAVIPPANLINIRCDAVCVLAENKKDEAVPPALLRPIYLRKPQAERERDARLIKENGLHA